MAISFSSHQTFLTGNLFLLPIRQANTKKPIHLFLFPYRASASMNKEGSDFQSSRGDKFPIEKLAMVALAAGVLALGAVGDAEAAKSGGRVGGKAFRSSSPRPSGPRINNNSRLIKTHCNNDGVETGLELFEKMRQKGICLSVKATVKNKRPLNGH